MYKDYLNQPKTISTKQRCITYGRIHILRTLTFSVKGNENIKCLQINFKCLSINRYNSNSIEFLRICMLFNDLKEMFDLSEHYTLTGANLNATS